MAYNLQATFSRGVLDPELIYRADLELFRAGLAHCENFVTLKRGGLRRRGGTRFMGEVKNSADKGWLIPFEFGLNQSYMLEFGDNYFRVYTSQGRVGTVEVATPYYKDVLPTLKFVQSTDTLFIAGGGIRPHALKRLGETNWTIEPMEFEDGPFLPQNLTQTSLTPAGTGNPVPVMTSNTAPSGTVSASNGSATAYQVFDRQPGKVVLSASANGWVQYQFPSARMIDAYMLQAPSDNSQNDDMPWQWNIEGSNNGSTWTILDTRDGQDTWASSEWREYTFPNKTAFTHYRLTFTQGGGADAKDSAIGQIVFHQAGDTQTPFNLTASSTVGINGGDGFLPSDVGRHIRFRGSDSYWRWFKIVSRTSATVVTVRVYGQTLHDTKGTSLWRLGAWSDSTGWPQTIGWHKNRLAFAGTDTEPQKIWESQTEDFNNFAVSHELVASDAVTVGILSGQVNRIQWLVDDDDLVVGTSRAVRSLGRLGDNEAYGPSNVDQKPETNFGASAITPIKIGSVLLYFGPYATDLREMAYDLANDGRISQSISEVQSHLFRKGMNGACYQQYPDSIVWSWDTAGDGVGFTYEREQEVFGMHTHTFSGEVECMEDLDGSQSDEIWMIVKRTINGQTKRYIEIMQRPFLGIDQKDAWNLDCALRYEGSETDTVSGLDHLEGMAVIAYADGTDYEVTVSGGSITLPADRKASKILVGLNVVAKAKTLPYPVNTQDGSGSGRKMIIDDFRIAVFETGSLRAGSEKTYLDELVFYQAGDQYGEPAPLRTGILDRATETRWEDGGQLDMQVSGGKPCTILAVNFGRSAEP